MEVQTRVVLDISEQEILAGAISHLPMTEMPSALQGWIPNGSANWRGQLIRELRGDGRSFRGRMIREAGMGRTELAALYGVLQDAVGMLRTQPFLFPKMEEEARAALVAATELGARCARVVGR